MVQSECSEAGTMHLLYLQSKFFKERGAGRREAWQRLGAHSGLRRGVRKGEGAICVTSGHAQKGAWGAEGEGMPNSGFIAFAHRVSGQVR